MTSRRTSRNKHQSVTRATQWKSTAGVQNANLSSNSNPTRRPKSPPSNSSNSSTNANTSATTSNTSSSPQSSPTTTTTSPGTVYSKCSKTEDNTKSPKTLNSSSSTKNLSKVKRIYSGFCSNRSVPILCQAKALLVYHCLLIYSSPGPCWKGVLLPLVAVLITLKGYVTGRLSNKLKCSLPLSPVSPLWSLSCKSPSTLS